MTFASLLRLPGFMLWFGWQMLKSSWSVITNILTPPLLHPLRIVQVPLASHRDWQVAIFGGLITLTPGTITIGVVTQDDVTYLLVHSMEHDTKQEAIDDLVEMERRMLVALPGRAPRRTTADRQGGER